MSIGVCPISKKDKVITLAHGGGGRLSDVLLKEHILPAFNNEYLKDLPDSALFPTSGERLALTTDSYVVKPLFFPGGDIGTLAITGTANDLAMSGSMPTYVTCSLILSEGLPLNQLDHILASMQKTALEAGMTVITGDTKVIERQNEIECLINTTGIGLNRHSMGARRIQKGDAIIVSGDIGQHGVCIMSARHELGLSPDIETDCQLLWPSIAKLLEQNLDIHCARDLTRGGLTAALVELAETAKAHFTLESNLVPINDHIHSASELLGLDPWMSACEGRCVLFVSECEKDMVLKILTDLNPKTKPAVIGQVEGISCDAKVVVRNAYGTKRRLQKLAGDMLPRIC